MQGTVRASPLARMAEVTPEKYEIHVEGYGIGHGDERLDSINAFSMRRNAFLILNPSEALREPPDVRVDRENGRMQPKHQETACDLYADPRERNKKVFGVGDGHLAQGGKRDAAEAFTDHSPRVPDVGCSALGETYNAQWNGEFFGRRIGDLVMTRKVAFESAEGRFAGWCGGARAKHEIEQFI